MSDRPRIGLDNEAFSGRLRRPVRRTQYAQVTDIAYIRRATRVQPPRPDTVVPAEQSSPPTKQAGTALPNQAYSAGMQTQNGRSIAAGPENGHLAGLRQKIAPHLVACMAAVVFVVGLLVSIHAFMTNQQAASQVSAMSEKMEQSSGEDGEDSQPSTKKPSERAFRSYYVAPDMARYIKIPKLGTHARVMQVGVNAAGELRAPNNVYDAAWYTGSAKPGQSGATLIDGHVSSWQTRGVFYGLHKLQRGDTIQIVKGDNSVLTYKVASTKIYDAEHVDMQAAMRPVVPGKPGLNLISCTGSVKRGTSEFDKRVIVFAEQL